jgi:hypothetical protein
MVPQCQDEVRWWRCDPPLHSIGSAALGIALKWHLLSSSSPKGRFPSLLGSSLFSSSGPIASRCGGLACPRWLPGSRVLQSCKQKFKEFRPLYIGLLVPRCRAHGVLLVLSLIRLDLAIFGEKLKRG